MRLDLKMPERIIFEEGCIAELGKYVEMYGDNVFLVVSRSLMKKGKLNNVMSDLKARGIVYTVFDRVTGEPSPEMVDEAVEYAREAACNVVVGIGGGSVLDLAKCVAALINNYGSVEEYLELTDAPRPLTNKIMPFVAVPTTAGTGSEGTKNAVVSSIAKGYKKSLRDEKMLAKVALVDPELTYHLPKEITARTGMDAITQIIESYTSIKATPITRGICMDAIANAPALSEAYENDDKQARKHMCCLSLISGIALANSGLGAAHGIAAGLGAMYGIAHGEACAVLLPHVIRLNRVKCDQDYAELAYKITGKKSTDALLDFIICLNSKMGIKSKLGYMGVKEEDVIKLSQASMGSSMSGNPVKLDIESCASFIRSIL